jgi:hypothetical protein
MLIAKDRTLFIPPLSLSLFLSLSLCPRRAPGYLHVQHSLVRPCSLSTASTAIHDFVKDLTVHMPNYISNMALLLPLLLFKSRKMNETKKK